LRRFSSSGLICGGEGFKPSPLLFSHVQQFKDLEAQSLYCPRCRQAQPVRERLLLVLPGYDLYEYRCTACFSSVGTKKVTPTKRGKIDLA